jgi:hypothetical protein
MICYYCFAEFDARRMHYRCLMHRTPEIFPAPAKGWRGPRFVYCPRCRLATGYRACPICGRGLPYYADRSGQQIVAITGWSFSGKTLYLWGLLHQLREVLSQDPNPVAVAMFEDDASFLVYQELCRDLFLRRRLPDKTQGQLQKNEGVPPVIIRLLQRRWGGLRLQNLVFYDPAGELIQNLEDVAYLLYLGHASALIYLVEAPPGRERQQGQHAHDAAEGLRAIIRQLRQEKNLRDNLRLPGMLAVALTKCDLDLFAEGPEGWVAGLGRGQHFWSQLGWRARRELRRTSRRCEAELRRRGLDELVNLAQHNFSRIAFFALSSLGHAPAGEAVLQDPRPIGVEQPLFWILQHLR